MGGRGVLGSWVVDPGTLLPAGVWLPAMEAGARQCIDRQERRGLRLQPLPSRPGIPKFPILLLPHLQEGGPPSCCRAHPPAPQPSSDDAAHPAWCPVFTAGEETCALFVEFGFVLDSSPLWGGSALIFLLLLLRWSQVIQVFCGF